VSMYIQTPRAGRRFAAVSSSGVEIAIRRRMHRVRHLRRTSICRTVRPVDRSVSSIRTYHASVISTLEMHARARYRMASFAARDTYETDAASQEVC